MTLVVRIRKESELPNRAITWRDESGGVIDFSANYTFSMSVGTLGKVPVLVKTTNITGANTAPNITISFPENELDIIPVGWHVAELTANSTLSQQDRKMEFWINMLPTFASA